MTAKPKDGVYLLLSALLQFLEDLQGFRYPAC